jgi:hypothetical protein
VLLLARYAVKLNRKLCKCNGNGICSTRRKLAGGNVMVRPPNNFKNRTFDLCSLCHS